MKIKKIIKIKNVGKFNNFSSNNDDLSFCDDTLIFGDNTYGKSTLVAIFRSMHENNKNYISGRKTFRSAENQEIEILFDNNSRKNFNENTWFLGNIEIFDNNFISKNVFYGDGIEKEQKANLYDILIDDEVRQIKEQIDKKKQEQSVLETEKTKIKNEYSNSNIMLFDNFIKLEEDLDVDKKVTDKELEIKQQENLSKIKLLINATFIRNNLFEFKNNFKKTLDLSIETAINEHVNNNWNNPNYTKDFLNTGVELLKKNGKCVFCGQNLDEKAKNLVDNFKRIFSDEYKELKNVIEEKGDKFLTLDIEKELLSFENCGLDLNKQFNQEEFINSKKKIDEQIKSKQLDLNLEIDFFKDENFILLENELEKLKYFLQVYQKNIQEEKNIVLLNGDLQILKIKRDRFAEKNMILCNEFKNKFLEIEEIKKDIQELNINLGKKVLKVFQVNKQNINFNLEKMGANFKLEEFAPKKHMGFKNTHFCDYKFVFDNVDIVSISNKPNQNAEEPEDFPHFKNTLSDSDKRLLAFAFFLSKLKNDENLDSKIIVLDDPFSSFDKNRKEQTVRLLKNIENSEGKKPLQKIIFTHEIGFLCKCYKMFNSSNGSLKVLRIFNSLAVGSRLDICDIENEFLKEDFFKDLEYIQDTIQNSMNIKESLQKVRPSLEHLLKRKYYFCLSQEDLNSKSINTYLDKIGEQCLVKNDILAANFHEAMHDNHPIMQLSEFEKIQKLREFLDLIKKI